MSQFVFFSDIITVLKSRMMRWVQQTACMGEKRNVYRALVGIHERMMLL
jgi:hypothetical protein